MISDMLLLFIAITWTTILVFSFINSWITASQYNWWKLRGYKEGQICLLSCHLTLGISIWLNVVGSKELAMALFPYLFTFAILFFGLWMGFNFLYRFNLKQKWKKMKSQD